MGTVTDKLNYLNETKQQIKQAIINKGQNINDEDTFRSYVEKINNIDSGILTELDANSLLSQLAIVTNESIPQVYFDEQTGQIYGGYIDKVFTYDKNLTVTISGVFINNTIDNIKNPITYPITGSDYIRCGITLTNTSDKTIQLYTIDCNIAIPIYLESVSQPTIRIGYSADYTQTNPVYINARRIV